MSRLNAYVDFFVFGLGLTDTLALKLMRHCSEAFSVAVSEFSYLFVYSFIG